jgi:hypothetical protein
MMRSLLALAVLAAASLSAAPLFAQESGQNKAVRDWNTNAFAKTPPANTNAFGTENGGKVTAFGNGKGETTNASGNTVAATNNARRLSNSFGTNTDSNASPVMPNYPVRPGQSPPSSSGR